MIRIEFELLEFSRVVVVILAKETI